MTDSPYNPLDKSNLARSIEAALLQRAATPLAELENIQGAGIYVLYYTGPFAPYAPIRDANKKGDLRQPIYIGKAIPKGGRKGGLGADAAKSKAMRGRLTQHKTSIEQGKHLEVSDFMVRHLMVDDIWIPLGENMLIEQFKPVWNLVIDGFGNKNPGRRREKQFKSPWDVLHPGRQFAEKLADSNMTAEFLIERVADFFAGKELKRLPKEVEEQQKAEEAEALDLAEEANDAIIGFQRISSDKPK